MTLVLTGSSVAEPGFTAQIPDAFGLWMVGVLDAGQLRSKYSYGEFCVITWVSGLKFI